MLAWAYSLFKLFLFKHSNRSLHPLKKKNLLLCLSKSDTGAVTSTCGSTMLCMKSWKQRMRRGRARCIVPPLTSSPTRASPSPNSGCSLLSLRSDRKISLLLARSWSGLFHVFSLLQIVAKTLSLSLSLSVSHTHMHTHMRVHTHTHAHAHTHTSIHAHTHAHTHTRTHAHTHTHTHTHTHSHSHTT